MQSRQILKRDGRLETWSTPRIGEAIFKAFKAAGIKDKMAAYRLASKVEEKVFEDGKQIAEQEFVQDCAESVLMKSKFDDIARRYIIYREQRRAAREMNMTYMLDSENVIDTYLDASDWRVNENANMGHSLSGLILHMQGEMQKKYMLNKVYPKEMREAHLHGYFHIHDLSFGLTAYCAGWSLRDLLLEGFNNKYAPHACSAGPANHFDAALGQMVNFLGTLQNEWAGAQAFNSVDTYLAPFIRKDNLTYEQVRQDIQKFVFNLNTTSRWGSQSPFTNLTMDVKCPKHIANEAIIIGGQLQDSTYGEYQEEMDMFNKAFLSVLLKGDYDGKIFSFPIPTYNVTDDFPWDSENGQLLLEMAAKYGIPYFQNFINSDLNPEDVRSMCPLHPDEMVMIRRTPKNSSIVDPLANVLGHEPHVCGIFSMKTCWEEREKYNYEVSYMGSWVPATMTATKSVGCVTLHLENQDSICMDLRHEQSIKDLRTGEERLVTGEYFTEDNCSNIALPCEIRNKIPFEKKWSPIGSIERIQYDGDVYCFVVENEDHLFSTASGIITHNCRLQMDLRELRNRMGGLFGAGDLTGSIGVVTINLAKLGFLAQDENDFMNLITEYATMAKESLEIKRKFIQTMLDMNQLPWTKRYLKNGYKGHFSTIGVVAGHEACMNLLGKGIDSKEGTDLMVRMMHLLRKLTADFQEETGNLYNLESTPAESTNYRFARIDRELYGTHIYQSGDNETPYYTNSTNLPVSYTTDVFAALEHQHQLQPLYTGGTVFHTYLGESMPDIESVKNFLIKAMTMTKIPYISITPTFSVCKAHGYITGEHFQCPTCGETTEVFSRIVGYYRPVSQWNKGKKMEYSERTEYDHPTNEPTSQPCTLLEDAHKVHVEETTSKPLITNIVAGEKV